MRPGTRLPVGRARGAAQPVPTEDRGAYGAVAVRSVAAGVIGALLLALNVTSMGLLVIAVVATLAFDIGNMFTLRNFLLVYTLLVFGVGGAVLHYSNASIFGDVAWYVMAFLAGYALSSISSPRGSTDREGLRQPHGRGPLHLVALEYALVVLIMINLLYLAFQFLKYGVIGYYQGQALLEKAVTYGKASSVGGAEQIVIFGLNYTGIALVILYVSACFESRRPIQYRYPAALFVLLPILSLSRFQAVVGALTLLAIFACDRRLAGRRAATRPGRAGAAPSPPPPRLSRALLVVLGMIMALTAGVFIASLRSGFSNKGVTQGAPSDRIAMFTSELTPVQAFGDIKTHIAVLGHPHGKTIVLPLLLKVVPRAWFPNKPLNSGAYFMSTVRPAEWAAGFALPPTYFGDAYLSFGFGGALVLCGALGLVAARLDRAYKQVTSKLPFFLLLFANFYALLRDPLSESLAGIALTLLVWAVANRIFRSPEHARREPAGVGEEIVSGALPA